jgi:hypothetical protein
MLWLKWVLGYCVLVGVGLWFGYRSRDVLPSQEPGGAAGDDPTDAPQVGASEAGSHFPTP